jgi:hypothetical protein
MADFVNIETRLENIVNIETRLENMLTSLKANLKKYKITSIYEKKQKYFELKVKEKVVCSMNINTKGNKIKFTFKITKHAGKNEKNEDKNFVEEELKKIETTLKELLNIISEIEKKYPVQEISKKRGGSKIPHTKRSKGGKRKRTLKNKKKIVGGNLRIFIRPLALCLYGIALWVMTLACLSEHKEYLFAVFVVLAIIAYGLFNWSGQSNYNTVYITTQDDDDIDLNTMLSDYIVIPLPDDFIHYVNAIIQQYPSDSSISRHQNGEVHIDIEMPTDIRMIETQPQSTEAVTTILHELNLPIAATIDMLSVRAVSLEATPRIQTRSPSRKSSSP